MRPLTELVPFLPAILSALQASPIGAVVLVCLGAFALLAFAIHRLR
jgi:hypothetical protein